MYKEVEKQLDKPGHAILDAPPPIREIADLKVTGAVAVYALLFESAFKDKRPDKSLFKDFIDRRDCGGLTFWSHYAISKTLCMSKSTVLKAIKALYAHGFISKEGSLKNKGKWSQAIYRVTHPDQLDNRRHALGIMGDQLPTTPEKQTDHYYKEDQSFIEFLEDPLANNVLIDDPTSKQI